MHVLLLSAIVNDLLLSGTDVTNVDLVYHESMATFLAKLSKTIHTFTDKQTYSNNSIAYIISLVIRQIPLLLKLIMCITKIYFLIFIWDHLLHVAISFFFLFSVHFYLVKRDFAPLI